MPARDSARRIKVEEEGRAHSGAESASSGGLPEEKGPLQPLITLTPTANSDRERRMRRPCHHLGAAIPWSMQSFRPRSATLR
jgi:hypothetical protein